MMFSVIIPAFEIVGLEHIFIHQRVVASSKVSNVLISEAINYAISTAVFSALHDWLAVGMERYRMSLHTLDRADNQYTTCVTSGF